MSTTTIELTTPSLETERLERCRVCLECMENTILLYTTTCIHEEILSYLDILHLISNVKVENNEYIPQNICTTCAERAESFYEFKLLCERSDKILESEFAIYTANNIVEGESDDVKTEPTENDLNHTAIKADPLSSPPILPLIDAENENAVQFNIDSMIDLEYDCSSSEDNSSTDCFNGNGNISTNSLNNSTLTSDYSDSNSFIANNVDKKTNSINNAKTDKFFYCEKCGEKFVRKVNLLKHTKKCAKSVPRKCPQCDYKPTSPRDYTAHLETHGKTVLSKPSTDYSDSQPKTCEKCAHCGFRIVSTMIYLRHLKQFHADKKVDCGVCKKEFYDVKMLSAHIRQEHPDEKKFPDECHLCGFTPNSYTSFVKHMEELHTSFAMKSCKYCDYKTISLKKLKQHIKLKHDEKRIKCLRCDKKYLNRKDMVIHLRRIHGEEEEEVSKKYKCKLCYKRFVNQSSLLVHEVSHSKESNYNCEECGSTFKQLKVLNDHMLRVHRLERKHKCAECSKKFFYKTQLDEHKRTHAEVRGFSCSTCGKKFRSKHNLQVHQVVHTGEKPHPCKLCRKRFTQSTGLKKHMTHHHGKS